METHLKSDYEQRAVFDQRSPLNSAQQLESSPLAEQFRHRNPYLYRTISLLLNFVACRDELLGNFLQVFICQLGLALKGRSVQIRNFRRVNSGPKLVDPLLLQVRLLFPIVLHFPIIGDAFLLADYA